MNVLGEVVLVDEFLGDVGEFDFDVLGAVEGRAKVKIADVEAGELGAAAETTLLSRSLTSSSDAVGVPTSPG